MPISKYVVQVEYDSEKDSIPTPQDVARAIYFGHL